MGIDGIQNLKGSPGLAHMYRPANGQAPKPGTTAMTLCQFEHTIPSASDLVGAGVCPNCQEVYDTGFGPMVS